MVLLVWYTNLTLCCRALLPSLPDSNSLLQLRFVKISQLRGCVSHPCCWISGNCDSSQLGPVVFFFSDIQGLAKSCRIHYTLFPIFVHCLVQKECNEQCTVCKITTKICDLLSQLFLAWFILLP